MINHIHLSEAWQIFKRSIKIKKMGVKEYPGNASEICKQVVEDCWNGAYLQNSSGHFNEFYMRDFAWAVESLLELGYKNRVIKTLEYALSIYSKKRLTTTITPSGKVVDIFAYSPDSLACLLMCLRIAKSKSLVEKYRDFLEKETKKYFEIVIDESGLVRKDRYFSAMKDENKRKSSCYDNCMTAVLSRELDNLDLFNPFRQFNYKKLIKENFWAGEYFLDDLSGNKYIAGDANIIPFWLGVFNDRAMLKKAIASVQAEGLDKPFPLKYSNKLQKVNFVNLFVHNYEGNVSWAQMAMMYLKLVKIIDRQKFKEYFNEYTKLIEKHKNFLEVFNPDGTPFKSPFYYADEGMIWAANYLTL